MVHDSQAYRKMDVTRERIGCTYELREILLSFQTDPVTLNKTRNAYYVNWSLTFLSLATISHIQDHELIPWIDVQQVHFKKLWIYWGSKVKNTQTNMN